MLPQAPTPHPPKKEKGKRKKNENNAPHPSRREDRLQNYLKFSSK